MQEVERELKNVDTVKYAIARLYLYPSSASIELGSKLYNLVAKAKEVKLGRDPNTVVIDGVTYSMWIENEVSIDYNSDYDIEDVDVEEELKKECEELEKTFRDIEDEELVAVLENSNSDFYVFALVYLVEEE